MSILHAVLIGDCNFDWMFGWSHVEDGTIDVETLMEGPHIRRSARIWNCLGSVAGALEKKG